MRATKANGKNSSYTSLSARRVMPCDIMSADPRSPLIPKDTDMFVGVESHHVIPHRLILSFIIHDIRGMRPFHSTSTFSVHSSPRSHLALVGFFVFLHDIFADQSVTLGYLSADRRYAHCTIHDYNQLTAVSVGLRYAISSSVH